MESSIFVGLNGIQKLLDRRYTNYSLFYHEIDLDKYLFSVISLLEWAERVVLGRQTELYRLKGR